MLIADETKWYALTVRHRNELSVAGILQDKFSITTCVPAITLWRKGKKNVSVNKKALFPTYVFAKLGANKIDWRKIFSVSGVYNVVRTKNGPAIIPDEQIESVAKMTENCADFSETEYTKNLSAGDLVEIVGGSLKGAVGRFLKSDSASGEFIVSVDLLGRAIKTRVESNLIRPW